MATILGDAKIKLSLDVELAKQELDTLAQRGSGVREHRDFEEESKQRHEDRDKGVQTTKNAPLRQAFKLARAMSYGNPGLVHAPPLTPGMNPVVIKARQHAAQAAVQALRHKHGLPATGQSQWAAFTQNMTAGKALVMGAKAYIAGLVATKIYKTVEASPRATAFMKGLAPGSATGGVDAFMGHVSDVMTDLRAKFVSFGKAAADEKALAAAALRLGQTIPTGGAVDLFHWLQHVNERQERMNSRVDKELDREVMQRLGRSILQSIHR